MPDIAMCMHPTCKMRAHCYRHADSGTKPSDFNQNYCHFEPGPAGCRDLILISEPRKRKTKTYDDVFWSYVGRGYPREEAAYRADQWHERQLKKKRKQDG